jgi:hypothetical protein
MGSRVLTPKGQVFTPKGWEPSAQGEAKPTPWDADCNHPAG